MDITDINEDKYCWAVSLTMCGKPTLPFNKKVGATFCTLECWESERRHTQKESSFDQLFNRGFIHDPLLASSSSYLLALLELYAHYNNCDILA